MDAQVDFGKSHADIAGVHTKLYGFEMRLIYSRKKFCMFVPEYLERVIVESRNLHRRGLVSTEIDSDALPSLHL